MKSSTQRARLSRRTVLTIAAAALAVAQVALAEESRFQTVIHDKDLYGAEDIEEGRYEAGIEKLRELASGRAELRGASHYVQLLLDAKGN